MRENNKGRIREILFLKAGDVMEWLNTLGDFISRVGFPIAAAIAMFLQNRSFEKSIDEMRVAITELKDAIQNKK